MKHREERYKVLIHARMRSSGDWVDAQILNVSSRGLLLRALLPVSRGTYIELRRGEQVVVGKVAWSDGPNLGVRTQDKINIPQLIGGDGSPISKVRPIAENGCPVERRIHPRSSDAERLNDNLEKSRRISSMFQYGVFAVSALAIAMLAAHSIMTMVAAPLSILANKMGGVDQ